MLPEIDRFVNWVRRRNPNAHTWRDYRADLKQFAAVVGDRPPEAVTFRDVDRFVAQQVARGLQPSSVIAAADPQGAPRAYSGEAGEDHSNPAVLCGFPCHQPRV